MGQYLAAQAHGDAFGSLGQEQRELDGQGYGLLVAAVVRQLPFRCLGIEDDVECKLRQACLDVTAGCGVVAREYVTPVALAVDEQVLLSQLHQCILNAGVAVGMELHGVAHYVGNLVETPVVHALHRVHDAALNGLESVAYVWHCAFQDYV